VRGVFYFQEPSLALGVNRIKKTGSLDPHSVRERISNFSVSISISFPTSAVVFSFLFGGTLNLSWVFVEEVDISSGSSDVAAVEFVASSFSCPSDKELLSSSSWYSRCSCWFAFAILQVVECLPETLLTTDHILEEYRQVEVSPLWFVYYAPGVTRSTFDITMFCLLSSEDVP